MPSGRRPAGTITFEASNTGEDAHELVVVRAADPATPPLAADGTVDETKLPSRAFIGEIEAFPAKQTYGAPSSCRQGRMPCSATR